MLVSAASLRRCRLRRCYVPNCAHRKREPGSGQAADIKLPAMLGFTDGLEEWLPLLAARPSLTTRFSADP